MIYDASALQRGHVAGIVDVLALHGVKVIQEAGVMLLNLATDYLHCGIHHLVGNGEFFIADTDCRRQLALRERTLVLAALLVGVYIGLDEIQHEALAFIGGGVQTVLCGGL